MWRIFDHQMCGDSVGKECVANVRSNDTQADNNLEASIATKALLGALTLNGIILAAEITAFTYMRRYFRLIYEPRCLSFFEMYAFRTPSYHGTH